MRRPGSTRRRLIRIAALAGVLVSFVLGVFAPSVALAEPRVTLTPVTAVPDTVSKSFTVLVNWSGFQPGSRLFITQCRRPQDPKINYGLDCSTLSEIMLNPSLNPTGSGSYRVPIFFGAEPSTDQTWGCWAPGQEPEPGYAWYNPNDKACYIRVVSGSEANTADAASARLEYAKPSASDCNVCIPTTTMPPRTTLPPAAPGGAAGAAPTTQAALAAPDAANVASNAAPRPPANRAGPGGLLAPTSVEAVKRSPYTLVFVIVALTGLAAIGDVVVRRMRTKKAAPGA